MKQNIRSKVPPSHKDKSKDPSRFRVGVEAVVQESESGPRLRLASSDPQPKRMAAEEYSEEEEMDRSPTKKQSDSWTRSIYTTCRRYARYLSGTPIFPSDFILYQCLTCPDGHLERVVAVERDYRNEIPHDQRGDLKV